MYRTPTYPTPQTLGSAVSKAGGAELEDSYISRASRVVQDRLPRAGVWLAKLFDETFDGAVGDAPAALPPTKFAPSFCRARVIQRHANNIAGKRALNPRADSEAAVALNSCRRIEVK